jgi:hypothetical protein
MSTDQQKDDPRPGQNLPKAEKKIKKTEETTEKIGNNY